MKLFGKEKKEEKEISAEELAQMVIREYIKGADKKFLRKVEKTAKGGSRRPKSLYSKNKQFFFTVFDTWFFFLNNRDVYLLDETANVVYWLESPKEYRNFYKIIKEEIEKEKQNY